MPGAGIKGVCLHAWPLKIILKVHSQEVLVDFCDCYEKDGQLLFFCICVFIFHYLFA